MATITYDVAGRQAVDTIPDELIPYYKARPGYTVVITEAAAAELKGDALHEKALQVGVEHPTSLSADEKRAAIVAATAPRGLLVDALGIGVDDSTFDDLPAAEAQPVLGDVPPGEVTPAVVVDGTDGVPIITPTDPPPTGSKRRAAADTKES